MIQSLFDELSRLKQVEAIALGGSRAGDVYDEKSDYDVYLYCNDDIQEDVRKAILDKYCDYIELSNHFWELEDNCTLKNGVDIDILYRNPEAFTNQVASVVEKFNACNGYTTCMWHNLMTCKIVYDPRGWLKGLKERFDVPYPKQLKENIISNNMKLLSSKLPSYDSQIIKAVRRGDINSANHRTAAFMESYFDIIFALNERTHPGEKRLIQLCLKDCELLPENFESNIKMLFANLFTNPLSIEEDLTKIVKELKRIM